MSTILGRYLMKGTESITKMGQSNIPGNQNNMTTKPESDVKLPYISPRAPADMVITDSVEVLEEYIPLDENPILESAAELLLKLFHDVTICEEYEKDSLRDDDDDINSNNNIKNNNPELDNSSEFSDYEQKPKRQKKVAVKVPKERKPRKPSARSEAARIRKRERCRILAQSLRDRNKVQVDALQKEVTEIEFKNNILNLLLGNISRLSNSLPAKTLAAINSSLKY